MCGACDVKKSLGVKNKTNASPLTHLFGFLYVCTVPCAAPIDRWSAQLHGSADTYTPRLMSYVKTVPTLTRAGADISFKRLLCSRRLRSTVTSTSANQREQQDDKSRGTAEHDSARSEYPGPGQPGTGERCGTTTAANEITVDFDQSQEAYKSKDSLELLRSLVVFKLCSYDFLVDKNKEVTRCHLYNREVCLLM